MQSTTDREGKLNEEMDNRHAVTEFLPVTSVNDEVITVRFQSPAASYEPNTELMRAGCMTWTVPPGRTLFVSLRPFRKGSEAERLALRFQHNKRIHFHLVRYLH